MCNTVLFLPHFNLAHCIYLQKCLMRWTPSRLPDAIIVSVTFTWPFALLVNCLQLCWLEDLRLSTHQEHGSEFVPDCSIWGLSNTQCKVSLKRFLCDARIMQLRNRIPSIWKVFFNHRTNFCFRLHFSYVPVASYFRLLVFNPLPSDGSFGVRRLFMIYLPTCFEMSHQASTSYITHNLFRTNDVGLWWCIANIQLP